MKTKELRAFCLEAARANAFGATQIDPVTGERWAETDVVFEKCVEQDERGARIITAEEFHRGLMGLRQEQLFEFTDEAAGRGSVCMPALFGSADPSPLSQGKAMFDIQKATVPEILKKYNELNPDKPVKRFADRATAEKRLRAAMKASVKAAAAPAAPTAPAAKGAAARKASSAPRKAREPGAAPRAKKHGDRKAEQFVRHHVRVAGTDYRSVAAAFEALGLPMAKHIAFRAQLKTSADGAATFKHDDKSYNFKLVAR